MSEESRGKTRVRSTAYPYYDLEKSIESARKLFEREGKSPIPVSIAAEYMGYDPTSSRGSRAVSALIQFGLLEQDGKNEDRQVKLTKLALKIIEGMVMNGGKADLGLLRQAAMSPFIIRHIWDVYAEDGRLPSDKVLRTRLAMDDKITVNKESFNFVMSRVRSSLAYAEVNGNTASTLPDALSDNDLDDEGLDDETLENGNDSGKDNRVDLPLPPADKRKTEDEHKPTPKYPPFRHPFSSGEGYLELPDVLTETELLEQWFALVVATVKNRNK